MQLIDEIKHNLQTHLPYLKERIEAVPSSDLEKIVPGTTNHTVKEILTYMIEIHKVPELRNKIGAGPDSNWLKCKEFLRDLFDVEFHYGRKADNTRPILHTVGGGSVNPAWGTLGMFIAYLKIDADTYLAEVRHVESAEPIIIKQTKPTVEREILARKFKKSVPKASVPKASVPKASVPKASVPKSAGTKYCYVCGIRIDLTDYPEVLELLLQQIENTLKGINYDKIN